MLSHVAEILLALQALILAVYFYFRGRSIRQERQQDNFEKNLEFAKANLPPAIAAGYNKLTPLELVKDALARRDELLERRYEITRKDRFFNGALRSMHTPHRDLAEFAKRHMDLIPEVKGFFKPLQRRDRGDIKSLQYLSHAWANRDYQELQVLFLLEEYLPKCLDPAAVRLRAQEMGKELEHQRKELKHQHALLQQEFVELAVHKARMQELKDQLASQIPQHAELIEDAYLRMLGDGAV